GGGGRGGSGGRGGGGSFSRGGGSFSRGGGNFSGGERSFSRSGSGFSGNGNFIDSGSGNAGSGGNNARSSQYYSVANDSPLFSDLGGSVLSGGRMPSSSARGESGNNRLSGGNAAQLPSGNRTGRHIGTPSSPGAGRHESGIDKPAANIIYHLPAHGE